jgi:ketosteroid isomerase-like protein
MHTLSLPAELTDMLASRLCAMTSALQRGDGKSVAAVYADDALLTDLHSSQIHGRAALDMHWTSLPPCVSWRLDVLESGGDPAMPYQRLSSTLILEHNGKLIHDEGTCFVVWKRHADGNYQIYVDIYRSAS